MCSRKVVNVTLGMLEIHVMKGVVCVGGVIGKIVVFSALHFEGLREVHDSRDSFLLQNCVSICSPSLFTSTVSRFALPKPVIVV